MHISISQFDWICFIHTTAITPANPNTAPNTPPMIFNDDAAPVNGVSVDDATGAPVPDKVPTIPVPDGAGEAAVGRTGIGKGGVTIVAVVAVGTALVTASTTSLVSVAVAVGTALGMTSTTSLVSVARKVGTTLEMGLAKVLVSVAAGVAAGVLEILKLEGKGILNVRAQSAGLSLLWQQRPSTKQKEPDPQAPG